MRATSRGTRHEVYTRAMESVPLTSFRFPHFISPPFAVLCMCRWNGRSLPSLSPSPRSLPLRPTLTDGRELPPPVGRSALAIRARSLSRSRSESSWMYHTGALIKPYTYRKDAWTPAFTKAPTTNNSKYWGRWKSPRLSTPPPSSSFFFFSSIVLLNVKNVQPAVREYSSITSVALLLSLSFRKVKVVVLLPLYSLSSRPPTYSSPAEMTSISFWGEQHLHGRRRERETFLFSF